MRRILAIVLLILLSGSVQATRSTGAEDDIRLAQKSLALGDYPKAYAHFRKAQNRSPLALFMIGMFHRNGWGRVADPVAGCGWFAKAARKNVPAAEHHWGDCLAQGIGRTVDIPAALDMYERAASHGHLISWCTAADYYIAGKGVAKDIAKGISLCTHVAQAGSSPAILKLARYYREGVDMPQDLAKARYWYGEAARRNDREAQYYFGLMLAQGEGGEPDPDAGLFWMESAAAAGFAPAYLPTAILYGNVPVQPETGMLAPEHLAKIYLWTMAAKARATDPEQRAAVERIETQVLSVMPTTWQPALDQQVAAHLNKFSHESNQQGNGSPP